MRWLRRKLIEKRQAAKDGRRLHAFYQGFQARRKGAAANPHPQGSELSDCWQAGYEFAQDDPMPDPPVCRFGPGGDFIFDWPEKRP